jgi:hypothetical protein
VRLPKNFVGVLLGLLLVAVFLGRSVPRAWLAGYSLGVIGPAIGVLIVIAFVVAMALDRAGRKKPQQPRRRHHP